jgi:Skp family chaperone for outer membrane proteins
VLLVTKFLSAASVAIVLAGSFVGSVSAQAPGAPASGTPQYSPVATLDMAYLFRNHIQYKQLDDALRAEVSAAEQSFVGEQKAMQELSRRLGEYKPGSPEYKATEEDLAKKDADLRLRGAIMQKNFAEKKAKNYFDVLQQVKAYVRHHAETYGIMLVVNFNGDEIDGTNPQSVMRGLSETVLYQHRNVDITPVILEYCNKNIAIPSPPTVRTDTTPR